MNLQTFIENFADQLDDTESGSLKSETVFKELEEWSSLVALSIIAMIDEEYDVQIKGDDIINAITLSDLFDAVKTKK